jgi:integrase
VCWRNCDGRAHARARSARLLRLLKASRATDGQPVASIECADRLFDDAPRSDPSRARAQESPFQFLNRVSRPEEAAPRAILNAWFAYWPVDDREDLAARFRARDERQFYGAFWELYLHEVHRRLGFAATRDPEMPDGDMLLARVDRPTARRLAGQWPKGTTRVARTMFADAQRDGLIASNPFTNLRLETPKGRKDLQALSEQEIHALADAAVSALAEYGLQFRAALLFLGYVGCRPGELCCIRREDLDARKAEVTIRFALDGQGGEKLPKNGRARVVAVPPPALQALRSIPPRLDSPYLFHTSSGKRLSKGTLSYYFRAVPQRWAGRDKLELYELRHACATLLMERWATAACRREPTRSHRWRRTRPAALRASGRARHARPGAPLLQRMGSIAGAVVSRTASTSGDFVAQCTRRRHC